GCGEVNVGAVVAKTRQFVIMTCCAKRRARKRAGGKPTDPPVEVRKSRNGDHLGESRGDREVGICVLAAPRDDDGDAVVDGVADELVLGGTGAGTVVAGSAETNVGHLDQIGVVHEDVKTAEVPTL